MNSSSTILGLTGIAAVIVILFLLLIFIFEVAMFINVLRNKNIVPDTKVLWLIGMVLIHPFVAIAYYFTDRTKNK